MLVAWPVVEACGDLLHRPVVGAGVVVGDPHQTAGDQQADQRAAVHAPAGEAGAAARVDGAAAQEQQRDRDQHHRRDDRGAEEALVQRRHDVAARPELDQVGADHRAEKADAADEERVEHERGLGALGEEDGAEQHGRDHGDGIGLEQVRRHAGTVADVVAHVVRDHRGIARVVFRDAGLDLTNQIGPDIGPFGKNAAAEAGEDRDQRGAERQADQALEHRAGVQADQHQDGVIDGDSEQAERHDQEPRDGASAKRHVQRAVESAPRGLGGAHVRLHRYGHADVAGRAREHGAEQEAEGNVKAQEDPEHDEHHRADCGNGHVLPVQIGHGAFLDGARDLAHARRAGRLGQDQAARGQPVGEADGRAGDHQNVEKPIDSGHASSPGATRSGAGQPGKRAQPRRTPQR